MATATLNGATCIRTRVHTPAWGLLFADVELDGEHELSGAVELKLADLTAQATIVSGGPWQGRSGFRLVAGKGGWSTRVPGKGYANDAGVKIAKVIGDAATEVGEVCEGIPTGAVGSAWERIAGPASSVLHQLAPESWYVGADGITRFGKRSTVAFADSSIARGKVDRARGFVELMSESIAALVPGVVVEGVEAVDVVHELEANKLRTRIWGSALAGAKRLLAWRRLFDQLYPFERYRGVYEFRVTKQEGERLNLQPVRVSLGFPDLRRVRMRPGIPGARANVAEGSYVLVAFVNADPARPVVVGFADKESAGFVPGELDLARADGRVLREGDTLTLTGVQPGTSATGVIATVTLGLGVPPEPSRVKA